MSSLHIVEVHYFQAFFFLCTRRIKRSRDRIPLGRLSLSLNYTTFKCFFFYTSNQEFPGSNPARSSVLIVDLHFFQSFLFCTRLIKRSRVRIPHSRRLISLNYTTFFKRFLPTSSSRYHKYFLLNESRPETTLKTNSSGFESPSCPVCRK